MRYMESSRSDDEGIPSCIMLDAKISEVLLDVRDKRDKSEFNGKSMPFIQHLNGKWWLCWATVNDTDITTILWSPEQTIEAGITQNMMEKASHEPYNIYPEGTYLYGCRYFGVSDEIEELIDAWLMKNHVAMMKQQAKDLVLSLGLEGAYNWEFNGWFLDDRVPEDVMRRDAIRLDIDPELEDDWRERLLNKLDTMLDSVE